jgi:predicted PurR-regulated permease PerM
LYYGKSILLPIFFAILLATLLSPVFNYLQRKKFPKALSILIPLVVSVLIFAGVVYFLSNQVIHFLEDVPALKKKLSEFGASIQQWFNQEAKIPLYKQNKYLKDGMDQLQERGPALLGSTVATLSEMISYLVLLPIYTFLTMYYKGRIKDFLISSFKNGSIAKVRGVLSECTSVAQRYVLGLCIETVIVFALNAIGFLIFGISYAIFLALLAALLNLIPYVGILVANVICIVITLVSSDQPIDGLWVGLVLLAVQFYDNNFGMPLIVGNKVKINALVTIVGIVVGGALCGIPGMFLAIPGLAVMKVVFDRVPQLEHWGTLLGDSNSKKTRKIKS